MAHNQAIKTVNQIAKEYAERTYEARKKNNQLMHSLKSAEIDFQQGYAERDAELTELKRIVVMLESVALNAKQVLDISSLEKEATEAIRQLTLLRRNHAPVR